MLYCLGPPLSNAWSFLQKKTHSWCLTSHSYLLYTALYQVQGCCHLDTFILPVQIIHKNLGFHEKYTIL